MLKIHPIKKISSHSSDFYQTYKEENHTNYTKTPPENRGEEWHYPDANPYWDITTKENYRSISFINIDVKTLKLSVKQIQQYIKNILWPSEVYASNARLF